MARDPFRNTRPLFGCIVFLVLAVFGTAWIEAGPGGHELFLTLAKTADFERGCLSVHGPVWWSPNYLQGQSCAVFWASPWAGPLAAAALETGRFIFYPFGAIAAYKLTALLFIAAAVWAMYAFVIELTGSEWTAMVAGLFYLLCPETTLRLTDAGQVGIEMCFLFPPLVCRALLRLRRRAEAEHSLADMLGVAMSLGAFFLALAKFAVLSLPLFGLFGLWLFFDIKEPAYRRRFAVAALAGTVGGGLLGGLPLLPFLREEKWMTLFSTDPLSIWQTLSWVMKSPLSWWDRSDALVGSLHNSSAPSSQAFYMGFLWSLALAGALLGIRPWKEWLGTSTGKLCGFFLSAALLFISLSYGLCSPWEGNRELLLLAHGSTRWFLWAAFVVMAGAVFRLGLLWTGRYIGAIILAVLFLFGSTFAVLSHAPLFDQIRAPAAFWSINGSFCLAIAGALALSVFEKWRTPAWVAIALLLWIDFAPQHATFSSDTITAPVYADYLEAAAFLRGQPPGHLYVISGRDFTLTLPQLTGKPLSNELSTAYLYSRWVRPFEKRAMHNPAALASLQPLLDLRYIVADRLGPSCDEATLMVLRRDHPLLHENRSFSVFGGTTNGLPSCSRPNYQTIVFPSTPPGQLWVIVPESYHRDWRAESDGKPVPVYRAGGCLLSARAAHDGAGVTFHFQPPWWYNGCLILDAAIWIVALGAWMIRRHR